MFTLRRRTGSCLVKGGCACTGSPADRQAWRAGRIDALTRFTLGGLSALDDINR